MAEIMLKQGKVITVLDKRKRAKDVERALACQLGIDGYVLEPETGIVMVVDYPKHVIYALATIADDDSFKPHPTTMSDGDFPWLNQYEWFGLFINDGWYATRWSTKEEGEKHLVFMHKAVWEKHNPKPQ